MAKFGWDSIRDSISVEYVKREILKTAYGNDRVFTAKLDPRVLMLWYLFFAIVPWFFYNRTILIGICLAVLGVALATGVSRLILAFLAFGVISELVGWGIAALLFGGDLTVFWALTTYILKLLAISLASIAIFTSLDPERFSDGLLALGMPERFAFGLSYGYRMIPTMLEEYHNIINAYRLRGRGPEKNGFLYWRRLVYLFRLVIRSFYPMILNLAKRTRTTVEGLEIRGFSYAIHHPEVKQLKLKHLKISYDDILFITGSIIVFGVIVLIGREFPL